MDVRTTIAYFLFEWPKPAPIDWLYRDKGMTSLLSCSPWIFHKLYVVYVVGQITKSCAIVRKFQSHKTFAQKSIDR